MSAFRADDVSANRLRLGVNIDHVATVRNARGSGYPDPVRAALLAAEAGADGITAHLREDRRHITDDDIARLSAELPIPLNLEMAATDEMLAIALRHRPHAACIVPEKREERTTEGGLDAAGQHNHLAPMVRELGAANVRVSLFIEPDPRQIEAALQPRRAGRRDPHRALLRADGRGAGGRAAPNRRRRRARGQERDRAACRAWPDLRQCRCRSPRSRRSRELNIGHFLIGEAIFDGLAPVVRRMRELMDAGA